MGPGPSGPQCSSMVQETKAPTSRSCHASCDAEGCAPPRCGTAVLMYRSAADALLACPVPQHVLPWFAPEQGQPQRAPGPLQRSFEAQVCGKAHAQNAVLSTRCIDSRLRKRG